MARHDGRKPAQLRSVSFIRRFTRFAPGSVLIKCGHTHVLCTAMWQKGVPAWREGRGSGWLTAEYDMLPGSTPDRRFRNRMKVDGRTQEIQRLIGRSLRAIVDLDMLGENSILIDCDVLQADGGTRTAGITGAYIAVYDAIQHALREGFIEHSPLRDQIAAISVGRSGGRILLDLDYAEDSTAEVDFNVVMTGSGRFVEVQGTGEGATFSPDELTRMLDLASRGIKRLFRVQKEALADK
ncbi:MAG: ribonuclease PH [Phycisphaerae bacterium]|nr:ribonuclease PH [Phycisphaerae bacterium]